MCAVDILLSEHKTPKVIEAKEKELDNLVKYGVFEEVEDNGQETIRSRWVIKAKDKHDGQKQKTKARLVARGFQETLKPQSDSLTLSKELFKIFMAIVANIRGAKDAAHFQAIDYLGFPFSISENFQMRNEITSCGDE